MAVENPDGSDLVTDVASNTSTAPVGLVATETNTSVFFRMLTAAMERDRDTLVTYVGENPPDGVELAAIAGATIISPEMIDTENTNVYRLLANVANAFSYPGIVLVPTDPGTFDLERAIQRAEASDRFRAIGVSSLEERELNPKTITAIPAFNEAETIGTVVKKAQEHVDKVFVIDDGSTDDTAARAESAGAVVIEHETNRGYGAALQTALETAAEYDIEYLTILDGDCQHDPADIPAVLSPLRNDTADIVIGSRFIGENETNLPLYRRFGLLTINLLTNASMGAVKPSSWIRDTQSGFRAYNATAISSLIGSRSLGNDMDASTDILYYANRSGLRIEEVGTTVSYSVKNASSQHPLRHGLLLVSNILRTVEREHPVLSLGVPGLILALVGFGFSHWAITDYLATGTVSLAIGVGAVLAIFGGVLACFTGLILHSLTTHMAEASMKAKT